MFLLILIFFKSFIINGCVLANIEVIVPIPSFDVDRSPEKHTNVALNTDSFDDLTNNTDNIPPLFDKAENFNQFFNDSNHPLPDGKIVGGEVADIIEYPYQLSLIYYGRHICGASLIDFRWVVTAAHCTKGMKIEALAIRAGSSLRNRGGQVVKVKNVYIHPNFTETTLDFDIAVLELKKQVTIWTARPIVLPHESTAVPVGTHAIVTGWGAISESGILRSRLQAVRVPILTPQSCQTAYPTMKITPQMFCAGFLGQGGKDSCQGDSGGALVIDRVLLGVVSWGFGCARPEYPGVYSYIPSLMRFVRSIVWGENDF